jgi:hypothetical protein
MKNVPDPGWKKAWNRIRDLKKKSSRIRNTDTELYIFKANCIEASKMCIGGREINVVGGKTLSRDNIIYMCVMRFDFSSPTSNLSCHKIVIDITVKMILNLNQNITHLSISDFSKRELPGTGFLLI